MIAPSSFLSEARTSNGLGNEKLLDEKRTEKRRGLARSERPANKWFLYAIIALLVIGGLAGIGLWAIGMRLKTKTQPPVTERMNDSIESDGFTPLFNGKDLTGWKTHPKGSDNWRVDNGVLFGSGPGICHLYTDRDDYQDFHLRVETRINQEGKSGLSFRNDGRKFQRETAGLRPGGYLAQIVGKHRCGSLWAMGKSLVEADDSIVQPEFDRAWGNGSRWR